MKRFCFRLWILFYLFAVCSHDAICTKNNQNTVGLKADCIKKDQAVAHSIGGTHLIAEFSDCIVPEDKIKLEKILRSAARAAGCKDLEFVAHKFSPIGITAVLILSESHISVHSYPENKYAAIDVFTCGTAIPKKAIKYLKQAFNAGNVKVTNVKRGQD